MVVFQYEWKRSKKSILIWAIVLAVCIFFMTPVLLRSDRNDGFSAREFCARRFF